MPQLRAIIIDDDRNRRDKVISVLPDYITGVGVGYGEGALDYLKRDGEGTLPDIVILYGDDKKSYGLYIYDWMINKSGDDDIAAIPVIVLTEDEFSDRSLEFLEIGDADFYEGEIDESSLFSAINDALEEAEFMAEPIEPSYEETKSIDRLIGQSVKAPDPDGRQRSVVLDMDARLANLEAALARGRQRVGDIKELLESAQDLKGRKKERSEERQKEIEVYSERLSSFLDKARKRAEKEEMILTRMKEQMSSGNVIKKSAPGSEHEDQNADADSVVKLKQKAMSNPYGAFNAQGTLKYNEPGRQPQYRNNTDAQPDKKKTVVIADSDVKTRKLCSLFLTQKYNVISVDSGIKTVDHFVKSTADLLLINPVLGGMDGVSTVRSVHMQPGGRDVPVMYLVGDDYTQSRTGLLGPNIVGILNKPIKQGMIAQSVDGFFENRGQRI